MMSRFTEKAQEALQRAQQIMFSKQNTQLDVEHIFLALLQQRNGVPAEIVMALGGDVESMKERLDNALNNMQSFTSSLGTATVYITLRANRVLQGSPEEARRLGDDFISTGHMLLAIASERGGATGRILRDANIDVDKIEAILDAFRASNKLDDHVTVPDDVRKRSSREFINPPTLSKPVGFSHGIATAHGRTLYLAGQTSLDAEGKLVGPGDVVGQYRQVLANLCTVVEDAGGKMSDIVKMTFFVQDRDDYKAHLKGLGEVHQEFFGYYYPATALLEVSRFFDDGVLIEIEGIAVIE